MYTYQDFQNDVKNGYGYALSRAINAHKASEIYRTAIEADLYDAQRNVTISNYARMLYTASGQRVADRYASNNKICSSFFRRLNTQRMTYSLGNGVTFNVDGLKERLGVDFDTRLRDAGYYSLIHGESFLFWNVDHVHVFRATEFAPLWDETNGTLKAGIRWWQIDTNKPVVAVLYEEDGYTRFVSENGTTDFKPVDDKAAYRYTLMKAPAEDEPEIVGVENYGVLPIVPVYGSRLHQSTLIGMKESIDSYDLIRSGFANDLQDCAEIYWIIGNAGGMDESDLAQFRDRLKLQHIATVGEADGVTVTPYTQEIPSNARSAFLDRIRAGIYEDFGGLDVHAVAAGATNDHIDAAYQPLDENADDFEYQIIEAVQGLLSIIGEEDTPNFKRNRISNEKERTEMVLLAANYLDDETVLNLLPFISPDMIEGIIERKGIDDINRFQPMDDEQPEVNSDEVGLENE